MPRYLALLNDSIFVSLHSDTLESVPWYFNQSIKHPSGMTPSITVYDPTNITMGELNHMLAKMVSCPVISYDEYCCIISEAKTLVNSLASSVERIGEYEKIAADALENAARERATHNGILRTLHSLCDLLGANSDAVSVGVLTRCSAKE